ncbi:TonB-dependent receptor [Massilia sp. BJB1822]|uniref:TonB-dependent receptor n=1 Tax=Massilia sp. BJB1822 TaxID=2744470 RepID=UPI0015942F5D|nr:TonB-dependent receptor [Massilia sp. BJB1822]NVD99114.1 TonB-dependent receptor [Massilia sp. BJB1822]
MSRQYQGAARAATSSRRTHLAPLALAIQLAFGGALAAALPGVALAQAAGAQQAQYDIPAGPLAESLNRFAQQAGVAIVLDAQKVQGLRSPGLKGSYGVEDGFNALLRDSQFVIGKTSSGYLLLAKPAQRPNSAAAGGAQPEQTLAAVNVNSTLLADELPRAYAGGQVARGGQLGMLGSTSTMDAPFNLTSYTAELVANRQASTVAAVLLNDPSVRFTTSEGHIYENFSIRGFEINGEDLAFNGLYGVAPSGHAPTEFLERVEVLKGPGALLGGMSPQGAVGGIINLIPKRATDKPLFRLTTDYTSRGQYGVHADVGQRFGENKRWGIRANGAYRDGKVGVKDQEKERILASVALDYRGPQLTASIDAYSDRENIDNGSSWMAKFPASGVIAPPKTGTNLLRGIYGKLKNDAIMARASYEFNDSVSVYGALGKLKYEYSGYVNGTRAAIENTAGDYTANTYHQRGTTDTTSGEVGVRGRFSTGTVRHQAVASFTSLNYDTGRATVSNSAIFNSNIYNPTLPKLAADPGPAPRTNETTLRSFAFADTMSFAEDKVLLTLGARRQQVQTEAFDPVTGARKPASAYDRKATTPAIGIVVKPWSPSVSLYANMIEGLSQGGTVSDLSAKNFGETFAPFRSKQLEAGVKWDLGEITNTLSVFQIKRPSMIKNVATNTYSDDGEQRNRGAEWNLFGQINPSLRLLGGAAYTSAKLSRAAEAKLDGKTPYGIPKWKANLGADWDVPGVPGLSLNGRVIYTGSQFVNNANTQKIGSWTRFDLGARFVTRVMEKELQLRANVENVANKSYWAGSFNDNYVTQGAGRIYKLSASVDF